MKTKFIIFAFLLLGCFARGQGFLYDQQSINDGEGAVGLMQANQPLGQSFTPTLTSIGFVALFIDGGSSEATIYVDLRSTSITGPILGSTTPAFFPNFYYANAHPTFYFPTAISVTPGVQYFFQPILQSGDTVSAFFSEGNYVGGSLIGDEGVIPNHDLWFQEGIVAAPEPSSSLLLLVGSGILFYARRRK